MAAPGYPGLMPAEVAFLCEMEQVTVVPRQRLEGLQLLGGPTAPLIPPHRTSLPLWLALLLKRQRRANIVPPPWLSVASLSQILTDETESPIFSPPQAQPTAPLSRSYAASVPLSPPFLESSTYLSTPETLPYHWLELSHLLLEKSSDDIPEADVVGRLIRDLSECRSAKIRQGIGVLEGAREVKMNGVGAMEVAEHRSFITGVVDSLRKLGASKEGTRREREAEEREGGGEDSEGEGDDMEL